MADKMKEIFGDDSEEEEENNEEAEEAEEEVEQEDGEEEEGNDNNNEEEEEYEQNENSGQEVSAQEENTNDNDEDDNNNENEDDDENNESKNIHSADEKSSNKQNTEDEEEENDNQHNAAAVDVFGDELADLSGESDHDESNNQSKSHDVSHVTDQAIEEDQEPEQIINAEISRIKTDLGKELHFVKLPNFLSVEPRPFDSEYYEDETVGSEALDEEGKTRVKLKVENTIRWRYVKDEDGNLIKQSNARIVKWSDGSLSMHLGNEIFDVYKPHMQGDHNHLFIRQGTGLQGQAVFKTKLAFRPHSTDSMTHRKMTMSLVDRGAKTQKVKILTDIVKNPETVRNEMMKKEEEKLKAASRRENQQRRLREKSHSKNISSAYLEDKYSEEDESSISLNAIKSKYKEKSETKHSIYSSGDESDRERRLNKAKSNDYDSDNERNTSLSSKKKKKVVADDDD